MGKQQWIVTTRGKGGGIRLNPQHGHFDLVKLSVFYKVISKLWNAIAPLRLALSMWSERHSRSST
jgi:hypothetical protein